MTKQDIILKVKSLNFPPDSYVVFGSCPMAVAGIREANDIDLLVAAELFAQLKSDGWKELHKSPSDIPLVHEVFEAHDNWNFSSYNPTLDHLLVNSEFVDNVPFASLEEVKKWKVASNRPKDLADIKLIEQYLESLKK